MWECPHRLGISTRGHGDADFRCTNVNSGCILPQDGPFTCTLGRLHLPLPCTGQDKITSPRRNVTEGGGPWA